MENQATKPCGQTSCPDYAICTKNFKSHKSDYCMSRLVEFGYSPGILPGHVDVIVPALNCGDYIYDCLTSVANQDVELDKLSVILIDDGSRDHTLDEARECKKFLGRSLTIVHRSFSKGPNACRNEGLRMTHGEFVLLLDGDSYLRADAFNYMLGELEIRPGLDFVYSNFSQAVVGSHLTYGYRSVSTPRSFNRKEVSKFTRFPVTLMIRRKALEAVQLDETLLKCTGWDLALSLCESGAKGRKIFSVDLFTETVNLCQDEGNSFYESQKKQVMEKHGIKESRRSSR